MALIDQISPEEFESAVQEILIIWHEKGKWRVYLKGTTIEGSGVSLISACQQVYRLMSEDAS